MAIEKTKVFIVICDDEETHCTYNEFAVRSVISEKFEGRIEPVFHLFPSGEGVADLLREYKDSAEEIAQRMVLITDNNMREREEGVKLIVDLENEGLLPSYHALKTSAYRGDIVREFRRLDKEKLAINIFDKIDSLQGLKDFIANAIEDMGIGRSAPAAATPASKTPGPV